MPPRHVGKPPTGKPCPAGRPCTASAPGLNTAHLAYLPTDDGRVTMGTLATVIAHDARTHAVAGRSDAPRMAGRRPASGRHPGQARQAKAEPAMGCHTRQAASPDGPQAVG
jgi:hypothetical protein